MNVPEEVEESFGNIIIKTEKPAYSAGEMVTGTVYLDLFEDIPANGVNLKVIGTEKTWILVDGGSQMELKTGNNTLYRNKMPLFKVEGFEPTFEAGQYTFPFSFVLGGHLPGSFEYQDNNLAGRIRYKVKAEVDIRNPELGELKTSQILTILEQVRLDGRRTQGESSQEIKKCCCFNKGTAFFRAYQDKPIYNLFEVVRVGFDINNSKCEVPVTSINASFRCVRVFRDNRGETDTRTISLSETTLPGVAPGEIAAGAGRRLLEFKLIDPNGPPIAPSTSGRLIENRYIVTITPMVEGAKDPNSAQIGLDITIVATPPVSYDTVKPPENWCAPPMPVAPLVLSDAFRYEQKVKAPPVQQQTEPTDGVETVHSEAQGNGVQVVSGGGDGGAGGAAALHLATAFLPLALSMASHMNAPPPSKPIIMGGGYTLFNPTSGWNPIPPAGPPMGMPGGGMGMMGMGGMMSGPNMTLPGIDGPNMTMPGIGGGGGMGPGMQQGGGFGGGGMGGGPSQPAPGGGFGGGGMGGGNAQEGQFQGVGGGFGGGGMGGGPSQPAPAQQGGGAGMGEGKQQEEHHEEESHEDEHSQQSEEQEEFDPNEGNESD